MSTQQAFQTEALTTMARACRKAARGPARATTAQKNRMLRDLADRLEAETEAILAANQRDLDAAPGYGLSAAMVDRLRLDAKRIKSIADAVRQVATLPDPVGAISDLRPQANGIQVGKMRIPLGVICMIYESRPNVTIDAAVLALKAGNGIIQRGGKEAFHSNHALAAQIGHALEAHGFEAAAVSLVPTTDRAAMNHLLTLEEEIDLVIPRGGEGLIRFVSRTSRIPVIKHYKGVCHLYVDADADLDQAVALLINGKTQRPGVCNALESLLVHADIADAFLPRALEALAEKGVEVRGCPRTQAFSDQVLAATDDDYHAEYLDLIIAVKVVDSYDAALDHIETYGSNHSEVICSQNRRTTERFLRDVDASAVLVNASSRFNDGGQLGLGCEIGISTTKLHAYGPMGLVSLTTEKFVVLGDGHTRD
ncbi:glutamate-5-semialdehyde dehydrogenase [Acanthopleuribacter pedis]|uniref:Gamma-glutamyl phosphate reductase n=1 Tax=Acanthopleuribacter pedis TaxID=442870 RepID=A0A8J7U7U2_9BACT|nr:glutamate-5-semialdehyde dehydrogenase [Acanthopleuribacter pedis]MBO1321756.1 glutamate-5-semialdehyde dehydrogenase [Acanthopleuribacter pedis]